MVYMCVESGTCAWYMDMCMVYMCMVYMRMVYMVYMCMVYMCMAHLSSRSWSLTSEMAVRYGQGWG